MYILKQIWKKATSVDFKNDIVGLFCEGMQPYKAQLKLLIGMTHTTVNI